MKMVLILLISILPLALSQELSCFGDGQLKDLHKILSSFGDELKASLASKDDLTAANNQIKQLQAAQQASEGKIQALEHYLESANKVVKKLQDEQKVNKENIATLQGNLGKTTSDLALAKVELDFIKSTVNASSTVLETTIIKLNHTSQLVLANTEAVNKTDGKVASVGKTLSSVVTNLSSTTEQLASTDHDLKQTTEQLGNVNNGLKIVEQHLTSTVGEVKALQTGLSSTNTALNHTGEAVRKTKQDVVINRKAIDTNKDANTQTRSDLSKVTGRVVDLESQYNALKDGVWPKGGYCIFQDGDSCPKGLVHTKGVFKPECCHE